MPTGYTHGVQTGAITKFDDFAWQCARAFGALVLLRDDMDAPIPEEFQPSDYHAKAIEAARAELVRLEAMTPEDANAEARRLYEQSAREYEGRVERKAAERHRYEAMLDKVRAWVPPSSDHVGMKDFMIKQLVESIDFDCNGTYDGRMKFQTGDEWRASAIKEARRSVEYHAAEHAKEVERTESRNRWIKQLRESLRGVNV